MAQQHAEIQAEGSLCYESETKSLAASSIDDGMKSARSPVIDPFKVGITEKFEGIDGILDSDVVLRAPFDSYADYIATREEYDMQHHEWVSSFYGNCMNARSKNLYHPSLI